MVSKYGETLTAGRHPRASNHCTQHQVCSDEFATRITFLYRLFNGFRVVHLHQGTVTTHYKPVKMDVSMVKRNQDTVIARMAILSYEEQKISFFIVYMGQIC